MMRFGQTPGLRRRQVGASSTLIPVRQAVAPGPRGVPSPFKLYNATNGTTLKVGIQPGLVNLISPTFTGASPSGTLAAVPPPLLTITATRYFYLKCVGTFALVEEDPDTYVVTVENSASPILPAPAISSTGFTSYLYLGHVLVSSGAIIGIEPKLASNFYVDSFGSINLWGDAP